MRARYPAGPHPARRDVTASARADRRRGHRSRPHPQAESLAREERPPHAPARGACKGAKLAQRGRPAGEHGPQRRHDGGLGTRRGAERPRRERLRGRDAIATTEELFPPQIGPRREPVEAESSPRCRAPGGAPVRPRPARRRRRLPPFAGARNPRATPAARSSKLRSARHIRHAEQSAPQARTCSSRASTTSNAHASATGRGKQEERAPGFLLRRREEAAKSARSSTAPHPGRDLYF